MKTFLLVVFGSLINSLFFFHEPNEAFFRFIKTPKAIEVEAEFPWSMRNALLKFNPLLEQSTNKKDFEKSFADYINKNLILKNKKGTALEFIGVEKLDSNGHSHQNNYLITFLGSNLFEVTNTIMFNVNENQVNHNTIAIDSFKNTFKTTNQSKSFSVYKNKRGVNLWYLLFLYVPISYCLFYRYFAKKSDTL